MAKPRRPTRRKTRTPEARRRTPTRARAPRTSDAALRAEIVTLREQQAATGAILKIVASTRTDTQPVLDAIAAAARRLCAAMDASVVLRDDDTWFSAAHEGSIPPVGGRIALDRGSLAGRAIVDGRTVHLPNTARLDPRQFPTARQHARELGWRSGLAVPILRDGVAIGALVLRRTEARAFTLEQIALLETFAAEAVIALENTRLFTELDAKNRDLGVALEHQTATAEILRVISRSPSDTQPVFESIADSSLRLLRGWSAIVWRLDGRQLHVAATRGGPPGSDRTIREFLGVLPVLDGTFVGDAIRDRDAKQVVDAEAEGVHPLVRAAGRTRGWRANLAVPMVQAGETLGVITVSRAQPGSFVPQEIALLQTFADQAVIAIENVRLFTELGTRNGELTQALTQQTATSEILRVISRSPTDVQPVFDAIASSATRLCDARFCIVFRFDGALITVAADDGRSPGTLDVIRSAYPAPPGRQSISAQAILQRRVISIADTQNSEEFPGSAERARAIGYRAILSVPMLRGDVAIGAVNVARLEAIPFTDAQVELLKTFADQAVIAVENVRLFSELQASNRELTTALDQQTATSEILRVISQAQTDVQPVFDAIVESAKRLLGGFSALVARVENDELHLVAFTTTGEAGDQTLKSSYPRRVGSYYADVVRAQQTMVIDDVESAPLGFSLDVARARGFRSIATVPMVREGRTIGIINVTREAAGGFTADEIGLLKTFADQAVIAIENVRLFTELEARNRDLSESLEQQTASAEILRVISSSPTSLEPVFDAILSNAATLCEANLAALWPYDGENLVHGAAYNASPEFVEFIKNNPQRPGPEGPARRAAFERRPVHVLDLLSDSSFKPQTLHLTEQARTVLAMPLLREHALVGVIILWRRDVRAFTDKQIALLQTFADQAVIAIENVRLFSELQASNRDLTTALDKQTATADILRVISRSQTDVQPVFQAIIDSAVRLLGAHAGTLTRVAGDQIDLAAFTSTDDAGDAAVRATYPRSLQSENTMALVIRDRAPVNIADAQTDPRSTEAQRATARVRGRRSLVVVPMLRHDAAIGTIAVTRSEPGGFSDDEIALLQTFADQAVIAIENVRLFTELQTSNRVLTTALDQQTATSEILRAISGAHADPQPVFDAIAHSALRLCGARTGAVHRFDGSTTFLVALAGVSESEEAEFTPLMRARPVSRTSLSAQALLDRVTLHIPDVQTYADASEFTRATAKAIGWRSALFVPMVRADVAVGVIVVTRAEPEPFSPDQISLLQTFAEQGVIAIENVRLFTELQTSNRDLTTALDKQTATSDILRVISRSQTDVQPVFDAIVASAVRLLRGHSGVLTRVAGDQIELAALTSTDDAGDAARRATFPQSLQSEGPHPQAIRDRAPVNIADAQTDPRLPEAQHATARIRGNRSLVAVPLLRHDEAVGAIVVARSEAGGFTDDEIALLQTFADQAVIAIENARLLTELQASNRELTTSLDTQTATSDILRVISRSQTDVQPVFDAIVASAVRLLGAYSGTLTRIEGDQIALAALTSTDDAGDAAQRARFPRPLQTQWGTHEQAIRDRAPLNIADAHTDPRLSEGVHAYARVRGYRSQIVVPMLRHDEPVGTISVTRREIGGFSDDEIALLTTFADQAVIAIENARLLTELHARTADLTRSVDQLTALGEVGQAVSSSLDVDTVLTTIVGRAVQLAGADGGTLYEYDEAARAFELRATSNVDDQVRRLQRTSRLRLGEGAVGMAGQTREPIQIPDITIEGAYDSRLREALLGAGTRALLAVPLLREDRILGGLVVSRRTPGEFAPEVVSVLKTFATQSALAIQNARLFREIEAKSRELEVASQHKSEFLANMSHELRTPLNAVIGFSEVLLERMFGDVNDKQAEYLGDILTSAQHLLSLINDILDLSKIEAGRMELDASEFDLPTAIDNALTLVRERAGRRGIALEQTIDARLGPIRADERKVKQVLLNLLSNALKFTPEGGRVDVRAGIADGFAEISVTDTGVGIAPEDHDAVFEEFRQVGSADKKSEGTGLGLPLAKKFIELHGGRIRLESQIGAGSTFTFTLPLREIA